MRKFLAVAMAALLLVCSLASCASGGDPNAINDYTPEVKTLTTDKGVFTFETVSGDSTVLVKYAGRATKDDHVEIPSEFNGRTVVGIGTEAFYHLASVVSVKIPDTVTYIDSWAFADCISLTSIDLPDGLESLGKGAFQGCTALTTVELGNTLTKIEEFAFSGCTSLGNVTLPETVESIGYAAFGNCEAMTELTIPASVKSVGDVAFYNCVGLETIKLHDDIEFGDHVFVTTNSTLKDRIDVSSFSPDSKVAEYVASIAAPEVETGDAGEAESGDAGEDTASAA